MKQQATLAAVARGSVHRAAPVIVLALLLLLPVATSWIAPRTPLVRARTISQTPPALAIHPGAFGGGHWDLLPVAPIRPRAESAEVWTGHELLVWGGLIYETGELFSDGAAYNPASRHWRALASSPLTPRFGATGVWTGTEFVVWGGEGRSHIALDDGASYDPASDSWRRIGVPPISARLRAFGTWTGRNVLIWGGQPAILTDALRGYNDGALYDPVADSWLAIPPAPFPTNHPQVVSVPVWTASVLFVWNTWERWDKVSSGQFLIDSGTDGAIYDLAGGAWSPTVSTHHGPLVGGPGIWTGHSILALEASFFGPWRPLPIRRYDPIAKTWSPVAPGRLEAGISSVTWVGSGLIVLTSSTYTGPSGPEVVPGDAAAYLPDEDRWIDLPRVPQGGPFEGPGIWTGQAVLYWGGRLARAPLGMSFSPG